MSYSFATPHYKSIVVNIKTDKKGKRSIVDKYGAPLQTEDSNGNVCVCERHKVVWPCPRIVCKGTNRKTNIAITDPAIIVYDSDSDDDDDDD